MLSCPQAPACGAMTWSHWDTNRLWSARGQWETHLLGVLGPQGLLWVLSCVPCSHSPG